jgi:hypothetical protein
MKDIVPELLETISKDFEDRFVSNTKISRIHKLIESGEATYEEANEFATEVGEILAECFKGHLSSDVLPDGRMYYNIADRVLNPTFGHNHELISEAAAQIQTDLNKASGFGIKGIAPPLNQDRIDGIIERVSNEPVFDDIKWILDEPVINFSQSIVDDTVKANVDFQFKAGLAPKIVRKEFGNCCDWCREVAGTYEYPEVPKDVFRRHRFCRCSVEYYPGDGRKQNIHTKKWIDPEKDAKIEARKSIGLSQDIRKPIKQVVRGHESTPRNAPPGSSIDKINEKGEVVDRTFYDAKGFKQKSIHTTNHGYPKYHPFGDQGEHVTEFEWYEDGTIKNKFSRELTAEERKENADLFSKDKK